MSMIDDPILSARRAIRTYYRGLLRAGERVEHVRFVVDPVTGGIVLPAHPAALEEESITLHVPDECDAGVGLLMEFVPIEDPGLDALCDRWRIYHMKPDEACWLRCRVETVRLMDDVMVGDDLGLPNPLAAAEPALCRRANARPVADPKSLKDPKTPVVVGVDPEGMDVRVASDIVRVWFSERAETPEAAAATIDRLLLQD